MSLIIYRLAASMLCQSRLQAAACAVVLVSSILNGVSAALPCPFEGPELLEELQGLEDRGLFFLDSRTTAETVALRVALEHGVPALKRDVFLDHERTTSAIHGAFERALQIARRNGHAVVIGHPYAITLDYLDKRLRSLPSDIQLVKAAELAQRRAQPSYPAVLAQPPGLRSLHISPGR